MMEPRGDETEQEKLERLGISSNIKQNKPPSVIPEEIRERILTDIGQASMCWGNPAPAATFDWAKAIEIGDLLYQHILELIGMEVKEDEKR